MSDSLPGEEVEQEPTDDELRQIEDEQDSVADEEIPADEPDAAEQEASEDAIPSDLKALAASMGFNESSIERLGSKEALEEAIAIQDRAMAQAWQQMQQPQDDNLSATEIPQEEEAEDIDFSHIDEDDPARKVLEAMAEKLKSTESALKQFEQSTQEQQFAQAQQQQQATQKEFDAALDSIGSALLGEAGPANQVQYQNRSQVWNTAMYLAGLEAQQGRQVDLAAVVKRAAYATLGDQLPTENQRAQKAAIAKRSAQRTGAGARAQTEVVTDWKDHPDIAAAHKAQLEMQAAGHGF